MISLVNLSYIDWSRASKIGLISTNQCKPWSMLDQGKYSLIMGKLLMKFFDQAMIKHAFDHVTVTKVWFVGWIAWSHWLHIDWSMCDQCVINVWSMYDQWLPLVILDHSLITPTRWVSMGTWSGIDQCLIGLNQAIKALTLDQSSKKNTIKP